MTTRKFWIDIVPLLAWFGFIFIMSTPSGSAANTNAILDRLLGPLAHDLSAAQLDRFHYCVRKSAHLTEYAVLAILLIRALRKSEKISARQFGMAWGLATLYAGTDEFHQSFVPGRTALFTDVLIDSTGALIGIAIFRLFRKS